MINALVAGDSISFTETIPEYRSDEGWTATLYLAGASTTQATATAGTNGTHDFALASTATANLKSGVYNYTIRVSDGTDKITVLSGILDVFANPELFQSREVLASKMVALVEKALANQLSSGEAAESISIAGRSISLMNRKELLTERAFWYSELRTLRNARTGKPNGINQIRIVI